MQEISRQEESQTSPAPFASDFMAYPVQFDERFFSEPDKTHLTQRRWLEQEKTADRRSDIQRERYSHDAHDAGRLSRARTVATAAPARAPAEAILPPGGRIAERSREARTDGSGRLPGPGAVPGRLATVALRMGAGRGMARGRRPARVRPESSTCAATLLRHS